MWLYKPHILHTQKGEYMFFVFAQTFQALKIIQLTLQKVIRYPLLLGLTAICIIMLSSYLAAFFLIEHFYFGVSIVDFSTVADFLGCPYTTHIVHTTFCMACLTLAAFILAVFSYCATYVLVCRELNEKISVKNFYKQITTALKELLRQAAIITLGYLKWLCSIFSSVPDYIQIWQDVCDKSYTPQEDKYQYTLSSVLYPHFIHNPGVILKKARADSIKIVQKKFFQNIEARYTFSYLNYLVSFLVCVTGYYVCQYKILTAEHSFMIGLVTLVIYFSIIRLINLTFMVSLYHYCIDKEIKFYPSQFVSSAFRKSAVSE